MTEKKKRRSKNGKSLGRPRGEEMVDYHVRFPRRLLERIQALAERSHRRVPGQVGYLLETHPEIAATVASSTGAPQSATPSAPSPSPSPTS